MKILRRAIHARNMEGSVLLEAEEDEDMYHLFNLVCKGDEVEASTIRNVVTESKSGARDKTRVQTRIAIKVDTIEFDAEQCALRLKGVNVKQNEHIQMGQYHTLEIEIGRPFSVTKQCWDSIYMELLEEMANPMRKADVAALVLQEGLANLCLIKSAITKTCAKIERNIPKKKQGNAAFDKAMDKFFQDIYLAIQRNIDFETVKVLLVGSPGFLKDELMTYIMDRAVREGNTVLQKNKSKIVTAHASSGYKNAIEEMLGDAAVASRLSNVKAIDEVRALKTFCDMMAVDPDRAVYGLEDVLRANEHLAIDELLITDKMYRSDDFNERNKFMALMESVKESNGKVFRFSSMHVSGEQLNNFTGIAATLRFPLHDEEEDTPLPEQTNEQQESNSQTIEDDYEEFVEKANGVDLSDFLL